MFRKIKNLIEQYKINKSFIEMMNDKNHISEIELLEICREGHIQNI